MSRTKSTHKQCLHDDITFDGHNQHVVRAQQIHSAGLVSSDAETTQFQTEPCEVMSFQATVVLKRANVAVLHVFD